MSPAPGGEAARGALPEGLSFWRPQTLIATWFGTGLIPVAPGTWGALSALPLAWIIALGFGAYAVVAAAVLAFLAGLWAVKAYLARTAEPDPGPVVIDEVAGQLLAAAAAGRDPLALALAFVLFRLFDIWKPWPVGDIERSLPGALGVMADDAAAALYAGAGIGLFFLVSEHADVLFR